MLLTMPALYFFSKSAAYEMPVATIVCNKTTVLRLKKSSCRPIHFICFQLLLCPFAYHNNFYWYRYRYLVFEPIIYFFNYHADKNGEESSNKICNVGGTDFFKCFNKSLQNKNDNIKPCLLEGCANTHEMIQTHSVWRRPSNFIQAWRSLRKMYCQGATESVNGFNSEFSGKSITARIFHIGGF